MEPEVGEWVFSKISEKLAKCAHRIRVQSMYQWDEKIEFCPEWRIQFKTDPEMKSELIRAIQSDHPYDVPQILAWDADSTEDYFCLLYTSDAAAKSSVWGWVVGGS